MAETAFAVDGDTGGPYEPRCILITGGAGFIASHVVLRLVRNYPQYKVVVLDKLDYCASVNNLRSIKKAPNFRFVKGDIQSMDLLAYVLRTEEVDTVMHFAAQVSSGGHVGARTLGPLAPLHFPSSMHVASSHCLRARRGWRATGGALWQVPHR
jgi:hypothetical protein